MKTKNLKKRFLFFVRWSGSEQGAYSLSEALAIAKELLNNSIYKVEIVRNENRE